MKTKIITTLLAVLLFASGCKDFLEETPESILSPDILPKSEKDADMMLLGTQRYLANMYDRPLFFLTEISTDHDSIHNESMDWLSIANYTYTNESVTISDAWANLYSMVNSANVMIDKLPGSPIAPAVQTQYIQAAKFLRALGYFHLVRLFGEIPLIEKPVENFNEAIKMPKSSIPDVYNLILSDLAEAEKLPAKWDPVGRPTGGAAKALLAKVYITMAGFPLKDQTKWALAATKAQEVIDGYGYSLLPVVSDLWLIKNKNSSEHIFSVQNNAGDASRSMLSVQARPREGLGSESGWGTYYTTKRTMALFDDADGRKAASFLTEVTLPTGKITYKDAGWWKNTPHMKKYYDSNRSNFLERNRRTDMNFPIFRLAEMYLIHAEATNEVSGPANAYASVNKLRERAYGNATHNLAGLSKEQFREAIKKEWTYETIHEGKRRYNLIRWEEFEKAMKANPLSAPSFSFEKHLYYPVPYRESNINPNL